MRSTKLSMLAFLVLVAFLKSAVAARIPIPPETAPPTEIVHYLLVAQPIDLRAAKDEPVTDRILSKSLKRLWRAANEAQSRTGRNGAGNALDMNWITTGQRFDLARRTLVSPNPNTVVAYLRERAGATPIVTFVFTKEGGGWRLADMRSGGGSNPTVLSSLLQDEIDAAAPRVAIPRGFGTLDASTLRGPASAAARDFLAETFVHCEFETTGRCPLQAVTDHFDMQYVDTREGRSRLAVALINYNTDMSGSDLNMVAVWKKADDGRYQLQASGVVDQLKNPSAKSMDDGRIALSGLTMGPNDPRCCPADPTVFRLAFGSGMLDVVVERRLPRPEDGREYVPRLPFTPLPRAVSDLAASAPELETEAHQAVVRALGGTPAIAASRIALDLRRNKYGAETGELRDHNGSDVLVFEKAGLIVYAKPKASLAGTVKSGDVLFRGRISANGIDGYAYAFKGGCSPMLYRVSGPRYKPDGNSDFSIELRGAAPVRAGAGCQPSRYSFNVPNATLRFGFAPLD